MIFAFFVCLLTCIYPVPDEIKLVIITKPMRNQKGSDISGYRFPENVNSDRQMLLALPSSVHARYLPK